MFSRSIAFTNRIILWKVMVASKKSLIKNKVPIYNDRQRSVLCFSISIFCWFWFKYVRFHFFNISYYINSTIKKLGVYSRCCRTYWTTIIVFVAKKYFFLSLTLLKKLTHWYTIYYTTDPRLVIMNMKCTTLKYWSRNLTYDRPTKSESSEQVN